MNNQSNVKKVIGVVSGKGGVGKSSVTSMLAVATQRLGYKVAILDADKEGFLRSRTSLVQTIGRAARNAEGHVIMYADVITDSMREAIDETNRRREIQDAYNKAHGIVPKTIKKDVRDLISVTRVIDSKDTRMEKDMESMNADELKKEIADVTKQMKKAAADLNFELAAQLRDRMVELKKHLHEVED